MNRRLAMVCVVLAFTQFGCGFHSLKNDLATFNASVIVIGAIVDRPEAPDPIYAVAYTNGPREEVAVAGAVEVRPYDQTFLMRLPFGPDYRLAVFQDHNRDGSYTRGEPLWLNEGGRKLEFGAYRATETQQVRLRSAPDAVPRNLLSLRPQIGSSAHARSKIAFNVGELVELDDRRFEPALAYQGLWEPYASLHDPGLGLYFLERYDPGKTPVLFVHGAGGTARDFTRLASTIDRRQFQVWVFTYPSGLPLEATAKALAGAVILARETHGFDELTIVAHSMGGLVARKALEMDAEGLMDTEGLHEPLSGTFISIATPWLGHEAAEVGIVLAPAAIPSWLDMKVGSAYTQALFETPLPATIKSFLAFTYGGRSARFLPHSNDGTVSVRSQLRWSAQQAAQEVKGFNEDHTSILLSPAFAAWLNETLQQEEELRVTR